MAISNLLAGVQVSLIGSLGSVSYKYAWLLGVIESFIGIVADVGLGIILFTLVLKLITLPLDIFSRASMKKNALKMEMMRDDLEKLQKQYANNKQLYQQKMMALYKKNGYSALMPCLPTIISLVFFIIVIGAFSSYSKKADFEVFKNMATAYDEKIVSLEGNGIVNAGTEENKEYYVNLDAALREKGYYKYFAGYDPNGNKYSIGDYTVYFDIYTDSGNQELKTAYPDIYTAFIDDFGNLKFTDEKLKNRILDELKNEFVKTKFTAEQIESLTAENLVSGNATEGYFFKDEDIQRIIEKTSAGVFDGFASYDGESGVWTFIFPENGNAADTLVNKDDIAKEFLTETLIEKIAGDYAAENILGAARTAARESYISNRSKSVLFPWVKNLWVVDSPFKPAIPTYSNLSSTLFGKTNSTQFTEAKYDELTYDISEYKQTGFGKGNGLFILVALSILTMLLSTVIMNKTQKTQMELSSVDGANGQAATQQKIMTWIMPIMFGVFAFIYSAGFSIYMVTSSILSTCFTLAINFCVEKSFKHKINKKQAEDAGKARYGKRR